MGAGAAYAGEALAIQPRAPSKVPSQIPMKMTISSNFGRFAYSATAELPGVTEPLNTLEKKVLEDGIASICFRAGGSSAEAALVKAGHMAKEAKRAEVPFSEAAQAVLQSAFAAKIAELGLVGLAVTFTGEHEYGETAASRAMATEMLAKLRDMPQGQKDMAPLMYGFSWDEEDAAIVEKLHAFLAGFRKPKAKK